MSTGLAPPRAGPAVSRACRILLVPTGLRGCCPSQRSPRLPPRTPSYRTPHPMLGTLGHAVAGEVLTQLCFLGSVLVGQDGLHASSSGRLALPGELPALSITSIHLEQRWDHQKLPRCSLGSQGMLSSYPWPCAQVSSQGQPQTWSEWDKARTGENPGSRAQQQQGTPGDGGRPQDYLPNVYLLSARKK